MRSIVRIGAFTACVVVVMSHCVAPVLADDLAPRPDTTIAPTERFAERAESIPLGDGRLDYRTKAGTLLVRNEAGAPAAELFYVAYELEGADRKTRPVTFVWDGGPGGSSMIMDIGGFGPRRYSAAENPTGRPPYRAAPNPHTLLGESDLVFIDLIGTGFSRATGTAQDEDFWGVDQDADVTVAAIERYLALNDRWQSPIFILGNSYGTTRAAVVADRLRPKGISLNGVILVATILNFGAQSYGLDHQFVVNLPTLAAVAWHHGKTDFQDRPLRSFLDEVEAFARGDYAEALFEGNRLDPQRRQEIAKRLSGYIGIDATYIGQANLRVSIVRFRKELLRDEGKVVGRLDGREISADFDDAGEEPETDHTILSKLYVPTTTILRSRLAELGYLSDGNYTVVSTDAIEAWDWAHTIPPMAGISQRELNEKNVFPQNTWVGADLGAAMRADPHLKVLQISGYFDFATPYGLADYDLSHLTFDDRLLRNITVKYYESGHMPFADDGALSRMAADLKDFYDDAVAK